MAYKGSCQVKKSREKLIGQTPLTHPPSQFFFGNDKNTISPPPQKKKNSELLLAYRLQNFHIFDSMGKPKSWRFCLKDSCSFDAGDLSKNLWNLAFCY